MILKDQTVIILIWKLVFVTNKKDERKKWLHELTLNSEFFEKYQSDSKRNIFFTANSFHLPDWHSFWNEQEMCNV